MSGNMIRCSVHNPCPICGATDYDMIMDYGGDEQVVWCHKVNEREVFSAGTVFSRIAVKQSAIGIFSLYKRKDVVDKSREMWIQEQRENNPSWNSFQRYEEIVDVKPLSNKELHERYSYLLYLLTLEDKHEKLLREEWHSDIYPQIYEEVMKMYPIRSLPPDDKSRYSSGERFKNMNRKTLVAKMLERFGDLRGIPMFYLRTGNYYQDKPEAERWTFTKGEGIIFPAVDEYGYIYRLRYRDDYPTFVVKGKDRFEGMEGSFKHSYDARGLHTWTFTPKPEYNCEPFVAYGAGVYMIKLNSKGLPSIGKASNKYKTLSSYVKMVEGNYIKNKLEGGCKSGTPYSIFVPPGCNNFRYVIATEGEKKAVIAALIKKCPVICIPGVGCYSQITEKTYYDRSLIELLKERGMEYFILCYDSDKNDNDMVANSEKGCLESVGKHVAVFKGEWPQGLDKGLDDILLEGGNIRIVPFRV